MSRPSRRVRQFLPLPSSRWEDGDDNGDDGIDWDTGDYQDPGNGLTVEESDGSPTVDAVSTLKFDAGDFTVTDNGDGSATVASAAVFVAGLDDLTDVTITSPVAGDRLRYTGSVWVNSALRWEPLFDGLGSAVLNGLGDPVMQEVS